MSNLGKEVSSPLEQETGEPSFSAPGQQAPQPSTDRIDNETSNSPPSEGILTWGSARLATAHITIDDMIPPKEFKRYTKYITVHRPADEYHGITLIFRGTHPGLTEAEDAVESPPLSDGIKMLNDISKGKSPISIDGNYQIKVLSIQSARSCPVNSAKTQSFTFNNGARHEVRFPFTASTNMFVAFDVINNASLACVIRFDIIVSMEMNKKWR